MANYLRVLPQSSKLLQRLTHSSTIIGSRPKTQDDHDLSLYPAKEGPSSIHQDYLIILPETLEETPDNNDILKIPLDGTVVNFTNITAEKAYKGISKVILDFENFLKNTELSSHDDSGGFSKFIKDIEVHLFPLECATNILTLLMHYRPKEFCHQGFVSLLSRSFDAMESRLSGQFREKAVRFSKNRDNMTPQEKRMLLFYSQENPGQSKLITDEEVKFYETEFVILNDDLKKIRTNFHLANKDFAHTVDDPDILASVAPWIETEYNQLKTERIPFKVDVFNYDKFIQVCPDRYVRKNLFAMRNKLCSSKGKSKLNNIRSIERVQSARRKMSYLLGYRRYVDYKLTRCMAESKDQLEDNFAHLINTEKSKIDDRMSELADYAADTDPSFRQETSLQAFDVDYYVNKYKYDIILDMSRNEVKSYFPLETVMNGLIQYYKNYFDIELKIIGDKPFLNERNVEVQFLKNGQHIGTLLHDTCIKEGLFNNLNTISRITAKKSELENIPTRAFSTMFTYDTRSQQVLLGPDDIAYLFFGYSNILQRFLYDYDFYELNNYGPFELDTNEILPYLTAAHLYNDHRILTSCSRRSVTDSKPLDSGTISKMIKSETHFNCFKLYEGLFRAHLDITFNLGIGNIKNIAIDLHKIYRPVFRANDNYDYCSMMELYGPFDSAPLYSKIWSKQIANHCLLELSKNRNQVDLSTLDYKTICESNKKLLNALFDKETFDTWKRLDNFTERKFDPKKSSVGLL